MTQILRPELLWIEGRCYRVDQTADLTAFQEHDLYENEVIFNEPENDEEDDFEIEMVDNARYLTSFHVSKHYIGSIIGKKGAIKNRIERDTKTDIKIPKQGQIGDVSIFGPTETNVRAARRRINIIVMSSRMKQRSTHFLSIPMNSADIVRNFTTFRETVLKECCHHTLDESLFMKPEKLHLTLGVTCLMDNEERMLASKLLTEAKDKIVLPLLSDSKVLKIRLKGLSYMNDDPKQIDVLYGLVQEEGSVKGVIQKLGDSLVDHFYKAGFMDREYGRESIKLHVTLINSKYRSRSSSAKGEESQSFKSNERRTRETFDGSEILAKFSDYDFGVTELQEIHLSQRHSMGRDGYYQPTCVISCR